MQGFCSVLLAYCFVLLHVKMWPYPGTGENFLKLVADVQLFLVLLVSLVLQIDDTQLTAEGYGEDYDQQMLFYIVMGGFVCTIGKLAYRDDLQKEQSLLMHMAKSTSTATIVMLTLATS